MAINKLDTGAIQDNAITNAKMADDAVGVADLAATGTPSSTTFLRGDNAWVTPTDTDTNTTYSVQDGELSQNNFTNDDHTKLNNIEALADVTDATNVAAAGAVMTQYVHPNHSGDVVSAADGAMTIQTDAVDIAMLSATGTPGNTTFLRGDNAWATAGSTSASDLTSGTLPIARIADDAVTAAKLANSINTDIATGVTGNTTANAALPKAGGTMTGNIAHAGTLTLDAGSNVHIDADGSSVVFLDGGTHMGTLKMANSNINLDSQVVDKDIIFSGNDGGSAITALTLDMSNGGQAVFSKGASFADHVYFQDNDKAVFGGGDDLQIYHDGGHSRIKDMGTGHLVLSGGEIHFNDSGNTVNRMVINSAGAVTMPSQPSFHGGRSAGGTVTNAVFIMSDVDHNTGSHYNTTNGIFTCPVSGIYEIGFSVMASSPSGLTDAFSINLNGTNTYNHYQAAYSGGSYQRIDGNARISCSANDSLSFQARSWAIYASSKSHSYGYIRLLG